MGFDLNLASLVIGSFYNKGMIFRVFVIQLVTTLVQQNNLQILKFIGRVSACRSGAWQRIREGINFLFERVGAKKYLFDKELGAVLLDKMLDGFRCGESQLSEFFFASFLSYEAHSHCLLQIVFSGEVTQIISAQLELQICKRLWMWYQLI